MDTYLNNLKIRKSKINFLNETKLGVIFPSIFKLFHETFEVKIGGPEDSYFKIKVNDLPPDSFGEYTYNFNDNFASLKLDYLFSLNEIDRYNNEIWIQKYFLHKILYIGMMTSNYPLYLECEGKDKDQIFFIDESTSDDISKLVIADNIFDLCKKFTFQINLSENINPSNIYKNWDEDFWRIKPPDFRNARPYELLDKDSLDKRYSELKKSKVDLLEVENEYKIRGLDLPKKFLFW